ncbi:MAG: hypothetical protein LUI13_00275 [Lachnospiraceae bacterium]|nr:hypothetical protein [Lachnospiraceae bacterium]
MKMNQMKNVMEQIDWGLFLKQKEWLYSQQCHLERWYGAEAGVLPEGILNLMDCLQNVWEEKEISIASQLCEEQDDMENSYWYEEVWTDEDLVIALENAGVDVTEENVEKLKQECLNIFNDKSERNEMLTNRARSIFDT